MTSRGKVDELLMCHVVTFKTQGMSISDLSKEANKSQDMIFFSNVENLRYF